MDELQYRRTYVHHERMTSDQWTNAVIEGVLWIMDQQDDTVGSFEITLYRGDLQRRTHEWTALLPDERKRRAVIAVRDLDVLALWSLTEAHTFLFGQAGAGFSPLTARSYRKGVRRFAEYASRSAVSLLRPEPEAGALYIRSMEAEGLKPGTVRIYLASARALYRALRWSGATQADPFVDTRAARDPTAPWDKRQPYTDEEVQALLGVAPPRDQVLILLCSHAGLRIQEALTLQWGDLEGSTLLIRQGKGGKRRHVTCSGRLREALAALQTTKWDGILPDTLVVGGTRVAAADRLRILARKAGVTYRAFHSFRHYAGTKLYRQTGRLEDVARHLGHSNIETTRVYAKWADDTVKTAVEGW